MTRLRRRVSEQHKLRQGFEIYRIVIFCVVMKRCLAWSKARPSDAPASTRSRKNWVNRSAWAFEIAGP